MSTCQGAPAPHDNCQHGRNCDWSSGRTAPKVRSPRWQPQPALSRRERRAAERAGKSQ